MAFLLILYESCQMQFPRLLYFASQRETLHYALAFKDEIFEGLENSKFLKPF